MLALDRSINEFTLLCERCGYVVDGLASGGACPECGLPIEDSLPESRAGSPWQRRPGFVPLLRTWWRALRHPLRTFDTMRVEPDRDRWLIRWSIAVAAFIGGVLAITVFFHRDSPLYGDDDPFSLMRISAVMLLGTVLIGVWLLSVLLLAGLTAVEALGLRFFGRAHGSRVTVATSRAICAHASVGWVIAGVLVLAGELVGAPVREYALYHNVGVARGPMLLAEVLLPLGGFFVGMLIFETLVYVGVRRRRFANRKPESASEDSGDRARSVSDGPGR